MQRKKKQDTEKQLQQEQEMKIKHYQAKEQKIQEVIQTSAIATRGRGSGPPLPSQFMHTREWDQGR